MKNLNLLVISNRFKDTELKHASFIRWNENTSLTFTDRHVAIIDLSFDKENPVPVVNYEIYDGLLMTKLTSSCLKDGLIVIVVCGYPDEDILMEEPFYGEADESRYLPAHEYRRDAYAFLRELLGISYCKLKFEEINNYEKKVKNPFNKYFNLSDRAYLYFQDDFSNSDIKIEAISRICGAGTSTANKYVGVVMQKENGIIILLPPYKKAEKYESFQSIIKISEKLYSKIQMIKKVQQLFPYFKFLRKEGYTYGKLFL